MGGLHGIPIAIVPLTTPLHAPILGSAVLVDMLIADSAAEPRAGFVKTLILYSRILMVAQLLKETAMVCQDGAWEKYMIAGEAVHNIRLIQNVAYIMFVMTEIYRYDYDVA
jgi:hypothetical protein